MNDVLGAAARRVDGLLRGWSATLYRWSVYWEMMGKQLRDRNAGARLSLRERLRRGHRVGTCTSICLKGPPYRPARWMRWPR